MQYRISTIMVVIFLCASAFGVFIQESPIAFLCGFAAMTIILMKMMATAPRRVLLFETQDELEAHLITQELLAQGITADLELAGGRVMSLALPPRILVPEKQESEARALLHELRNRSVDADEAFAQGSGHDSDIPQDHDEDEESDER